jgi:hypothetical protein
MDGGWHPDPTGRHEYRYWDGSRWTSAVADAGEQSDDPPTWPKPPADEGLGLRSGYLRYLRRGAGPWPVVDLAGTQVGQVARSSFALAGRSAGVWDMAGVQWVGVKQSLHGTLILLGDREVGRITWHGAGSKGTVDIALHLLGRMRGQMRATRAQLASGEARVVDPTGCSLLSLRAERDRDGVAVTLRRLVTTPEDYEFLVQAIVPAIILELDSRAGFHAAHDGQSSTFSSPGPWPD